MSNAGQAVLSIVGGVVGFVVGGPAGAAWGFQLGNMAGQVIFPTDLGTVRGPRIDDTRVMISSIGAPIPIVYGTYAVAGNVIWSSGLIETEHKEEAGGKGGPTQTVETYTYSVDCAVAICEGPIKGIRRIWADAICIYDVSEVTDIDMSRIEEMLISPNPVERATAQLILETFAGSEQIASIMTVYLGDETQEPDPVIESYKGVGEVPAYRGLAYVVFHGLQLERFGNRIPNLRFEVYTGDPVTDEYITFSNAVLHPWLRKSDDPRSVANEHEYRIEHYGMSDLLSQYTGPTDPTSNIEAIKTAFTYPQDTYIGYATRYNGTFTNRMGGPLAWEEEFLYLEYTSYSGPLTYQTTGWVGVCEDAPADIGGTECVPAIYGEYYPHVINYVKLVQRLPDGVTISDGVDFFFAVVCYNPTYVQVGAPIAIRVARVPRKPLDTADDPWYTPIPDAPNYYVGQDGIIERGKVWTYQAGTFKVLQQYTVETIDGVTFVTKYPLNPTLASTHVDYNSQEFWEAAYAKAVINGQMEAGLTYGVDYPVVQSWAYGSTYDTSTVTTESVAVADIVENLCNRVRLYDVDVSDITARVDGYAIARVMVARDAIDPLRTVALFDAVENGTTLQFVKRGHPAAVTVDPDHLRAHVTDGDKPTAVKVTRTQEKDLPRRLRFHYVSPERDYEPGEQSASRISTKAMGDADIETAVAMSDERAAQLAEILLYNTWAGRNRYEYHLDNSYLPYIPTDCMLLPVDDEYQRVRVISCNYAIGGILSYESTGDDDGVYESTAVPTTPAGSGGIAVGPSGSLVGPSGVVLLDLPALRTEDTDAGYYAAAWGYLDSWTYTGIYRSSDGGTTYGLVGSTNIAGVVGTINADLTPPESPWYSGSSPMTFDETTELDVVLVSGSSLASATEESLAAGSNTAAIGADGRWEIIQFRDATYIGADVWRLTGLLRERLGTVIGDTFKGDTFVLLSDPGLFRIPETPASIGVEKLIKPVSGGQSIDSAVAIPFTTQGLSYKPSTIGSLDDVDAPDPSEGDVLTWDPVTGKWVATSGTRVVGAVWGSANALVAADCADVDVQVPISATIKKVTIMTSGGPGSCVIDIWKDSLGNFPPVVGDSITAAAKPTISVGVTYEDTTLAGWSTSVAAGDVLRFHVDSTTDFHRITVILSLEPKQ